MLKTIIEISKIIFKQNILITTCLLEAGSFALFNSTNIKEHDNIKIWRLNIYIYCYITEIIEFRYLVSWQMSCCCYLKYKLNTYQKYILIKLEWTHDICEVRPTAKICCLFLFPVLSQWIEDTFRFWNSIKYIYFFFVL